MKRHEIPAAALIFLFGTVTAYLSTRMPIGEFRAAGSGLFPLCLGILLILLSGVHILDVRIKNGRRRGADDSASAEPRTASQVLLFMSAIVAATFLLRPLGYPLVSFLLLLVLLRILGVKNFGLKNWGLNLLLALATASASYFLFVKVLKIPFPKGWIG